MYIFNPKKVKCKNLIFLELDYLIEPFFILYIIKSIHNLIIMYFIDFR